MKNPCPICHARKAQRLCFRHNNTTICSVCCAQMRNETCAGCTYHATAQQYQAERSLSSQRARRSNNNFVLALDPEVEDAVDAALHLYEQGETDAAWAQVTRLLRAHPKNHSVCYAMGVLHGFKNDVKGAVQWFDKAIEIFPYFVEAHFNKGVALQKDLQLVESVQAFRKVVAYGDPKDEATQRAQGFLNNMAASMREINGVDMDTYLEGQVLFDQAFVLMEREDWSAALKGFRNSAAKFDRNATTHGNIGLCLAKLGHKAQALAELDYALEIDPRYKPATMNRKVCEQMEEGEPLSNTHFMRINYGRDQVMRQLDNQPDA